MFLVKPAYAICPVCIVAVGGGLVIAEKLGVDDLIAALWIGALMTAFAFWAAEKFKRIKLPKPEISWPILFYLMTLGVLKIQGKINNPYCKIWGICKIWLGLTVGTIVFWLGVLMDKFLRRRNNGKAFFPFQKVIIPLAAVILMSWGFYLITCQ